MKSAAIPAGICDDCARKRGLIPPKHSVISTWQGPCTVCGETKDVSSPEDWVAPLKNKPRST